MPILTLSLGMGLCIAGGTLALNAFAGAYYPTYIRSTGVGWALGVGRSGIVFAGILGTIVLAWHWPLPAVFLTIGVFALLVAAATFLIGVSQRGRCARRGPVILKWDADH